MGPSLTACPSVVAAFMRPNPDVASQGARRYLVFDWEGCSNHLASVVVCAAGECADAFGLQPTADGLTCVGGPEADLGGLDVQVNPLLGPETDADSWRVRVLVDGDLVESIGHDADAPSEPEECSKGACYVTGTVFSGC